MALEWGERWGSVPAFDGLEKHMSTTKLARVRGEGQVTLPAEVRSKLGIKAGDLIAFELTDDGDVLVVPQQRLAIQSIAEADRLLVDQGLTLDEVIEHGRAIRSRLVKEMYGIDDEEQ